MSADPLVSVVVPAHNSEATLGETLSSALASTYRNLQLIVVDDGSTDGTAEIVREVMEADNRVELLRRPQGGLSAASNSGIASARGEFVARLDSDDLWHPTKIAKQVALARSDLDAAYITTFLRCIDEQSRVVADVRQQRFPRRALCRGIYESLVGANSSALIRRSVIDEMGGYDEALTARQDLMLQLRINARYPIALVPEYLVGYRIRAGSMSTDPQAMLASWKQVRGEIDRRFPQVPATVLRWADARQLSEAAEGFAWRRRHSTAARLLLAAMAKDPLRIALFLGYRSARKLARQLQRSPEETDRPLFYDCDPLQAVATAETDAQAAPVLQLVDDRRNRALARIDHQLVEGGVIRPR